MRKIQKILIGIFFGGVLLGGIGTGIALVEYSSFSYAGEKKIGSEHVITRDFDYSFDPEYGKIAVGCSWPGDPHPGSRLETDARVPQNTIRYTITYNDKTTQPYLICDEIPAEDRTMEDGEETAKQMVQGVLDVGTRSVVHDFALWMECKDEVLKDLKQRRIASYEAEYITDIRIKVNPETMQNLLDETG